MKRPVFKGALCKATSTLIHTDLKTAVSFENVLRVRWCFQTFSKNRWSTLKHLKALTCPYCACVKTQEALAYDVSVSRLFDLPYTLELMQHCRGKRTDEEVELLPRATRDYKVGLLLFEWVT